jgi:hypothetical protein
MGLAMRFEPGLVPMKYPASKDFSDDYFDCHKGFIAVEVGLGYYRTVEDTGYCRYVVSHVLSGFRLPGEFLNEQQAQSMIIALAEIGIDWWLPLKALQALPAWKTIREVYDGIVTKVCPEVGESASTTEATNGA